MFISIYEHENVFALNTNTENKHKHIFLSISLNSELAHMKLL